MKFITIHWAFVLLFLNTKLSMHSNRQCLQKESKLLKAFKLSWGSSHSHLSLPKWHSWMNAMSNKSDLFWAWIQPALHSRTPGTPKMLLLVPDTEVFPVALADTGRQGGARQSFTKIPCPKDIFSTSNLTRLTLNSMSFLQFWIK